MITFQGNKQVLKSAKLLESRARNTYPHISTSKIRTQIGYDTPTPAFLEHVKKDYKLTRQMIRESGDYYLALVYALSEGKVGNCIEDSLFTELLGKINGQHNIYTGCLSINRNGNSKFLDHVVAFITDKEVLPNLECKFKNKEAVIIDPWLGVTDFAENYFTKLKSIFRKTFMHHRSNFYGTFSNDALADELIRSESKTVEEFKAKKKEYCPKTTLSIVPFIDNSLNNEKIEEIKASFPELTIKNFKKIVLEKKNNPIDTIA